MRLTREINMEKVREWKPLFKVRPHRGLELQLPLDKKPGNQRRTGDESRDLEMPKVGYEVYTDGPTRVLRISEFHGSSNEDKVLQTCAKIRLRVSYFLVHLLEHGKQVSLHLHIKIINKEMFSIILLLSLISLVAACTFVCVILL